MILKLIDWLLRRRGFKRIPADARIEWVPYHVVALTARALELAKAEDVKPQGGEYKRHQVYARMLKEFPYDQKRDISWAIERAVRNL